MAASPLFCSIAQVCSQLLYNTPQSSMVHFVSWLLTTYFATFQQIDQWGNEDMTVTWTQLGLLSSTTLKQYTKEF
jgi:hypothetical protein